MTRLPIVALSLGFFALSAAPSIATAAVPSSREQVTLTFAVNGTIATKGYTVSSLPGSPGTGARAQVTDATACTFGYTKRWPKLSPG